MQQQTVGGGPQAIDIYRAEHGSVFMNGIQALVRLPLMQRRWDRRHGLRTAGLISGYRGSPLGGYDQQLWKAAAVLKEHDVVFQPGLNEDLAATALWGSQMLDSYGEATVDGVFGIWYGKGPGVDRCGDVFRAANMLGTAAHGGVLAIAGDDHAAQSSIFPHQTDGIFQSTMIPVLQPASVREILTVGMAGLALSRATGVWAAMKTIAEVVESAATFELPDPYPAFHAVPDATPPHGLNWDPRVLWPANRVEWERRLLEERIPAVKAWAALNRLDGPVASSGMKGLCIVTVGKAHQDVMQALDDLGLSARELSELGVSIYKVVMSWPLDSASLLAFAAGFKTIFVVEEKQPIVEDQLKIALYHHATDRRPRVVGKRDTDNNLLLRQTLELDALTVAGALVKLLSETPAGPALAHRLNALGAAPEQPEATKFPSRKPFFCAGCPHNTSTKTPTDAISGGGIGCHAMAMSQPSLKTSTFSHMGAEGVQWIGAGPFSKRKHMFQNLGDGTYQHSGVLAIRAAIAAKAAITYKILYNDAVAMTGGQPVEGALSPLMIARQLAAEGVADIRLVSDDPEKWRGDGRFAGGVRIHHRDELDAVQRDLSRQPTVTAIIYEQTCAAEKRRRRKRGVLPEPQRRLFINPRVCEGCGDCSVQSNCIAVEPLTTNFGVKRRINQSSCNKDFSCVKGFCPSFVDVEGAELAKPDAARIASLEAAWFVSLPEPALTAPERDCNIYIAGVGGLGVLTLGAVIGTAAHASGLSASVLDFTGLAQKNGAVVSHVRIAPPGRPLHAVRIGDGQLDLLIATDTVAAGSPDAVRKLAAGRSVVAVNVDEMPTADVVTDRDAALPIAQIAARLAERAGGRAHEVHMTDLAQRIFGDTLAVNTMMLGYAWQKGFVPLPLDAIQMALRANGAAVEMNLRALNWGRLAASDPRKAEEGAGPAPPAAGRETLDAFIERRAGDLRAYQNEAYAERYRALVQKMQAAAGRFGTAGDQLTATVAANAYRVMAYKDEYEVARLYTDPAFRAALKETFSSVKKIGVWLAPPLLSRIDPNTGRPAKRKYGAWIFTGFKVLAGLKGLRGTRADIFGWSAERRAERKLIADYTDDIEDVIATLSTETLPVALKLMALPAEIRGFGPVKMAALAQAEGQRSVFRGDLRRERDEPKSAA